MDYIKWLVLERHREFFENGFCIPIFFLNCLLVVVFLVAYVPLGILAISVTLPIWILIAYCFAQEAFKRHYQEYLNQRNQ